MKWTSALAFSALCLTALPTLVNAAPPVEKDAAGTPIASFDENSSGNMLGTFYNYADRSGNSSESDTNNVTLGYWRFQPGYEANYVLVTGADSNFKSGASRTDTGLGNITIGHMWAIPPLGNTTYLAANIGGNQSSYKSGGNNNRAFAKNVGISGGFTQLLPIFPTIDDVLVVGGAFSVSYIDFDDDLDDHQGFTTSIYPSLQLRHSFTPELSGFARAAATISSQPASFGGDHVLYTPSIGLDYTMGDTSIGVQYAREYADDAKGQNIGLALTHRF